MDQDPIMIAWEIFGQDAIDFIKQHKELRAEGDSSSMAPTLAEYLSILVSQVEDGKSPNEVLTENQIPTLLEEGRTGEIVRAKYTYDGLREYIHTFTVTDIIDQLRYIFEDNYGAIDRANALALIRSRAAELKQEPTINKAIRAYEAELQRKHPEEDSAFPIRADLLRLTKDGKPKNSINNFHAIMVNDPYYNGGEPFYQRMLFNVVTNRAEIHTLDRGGNILSVRNWEEADEARSRAYIEEYYDGLDNADKHRAALLMFFQDREYNPVTIKLDSLRGTWDGVERCSEYLTKWGKADNSEYTRAVSRMLFDGAVARAYSPGIQFDNVPVLTGRQGTGKTSLCKFLNITRVDRYCVSMSKFSKDEKRNYEKIEGKWIVELAEFFTKNDTTIQGELKDFITSTLDTYRKAFGRGVSDLPRRCVFIGTTNIPDFLSDLTGNRRFFPVETHCNGRFIHNNEEEIRKYVELCYAEAIDHYDHGSLLLAMPEELENEARAIQSDAMQASFVYDAVMEYIDSLKVGDEFCIKDIWSSNYLPLSPRDVLDKRIEQTISTILRNCTSVSPGRRKWDKGHASRRTFFQKIDPNRPPIDDD